MSITRLLTLLSFLAISYLCLIAQHGGDIKKASKDFSDAFADGLADAMDTIKK